MYFEEQVISGVLHFRTDPAHEFRPYSAEELTARVIELERKIVSIRAAVA